MAGFTAGKRNNRSDASKGGVGCGEETGARMQEAEQMIQDAGVVDAGRAAPSRVHEFQIFSDPFRSGSAPMSVFCRTAERFHLRPLGGARRRRFSGTGERPPSSAVSA